MCGSSLNWCSCAICHACASVEIPYGMQKKCCCTGYLAQVRALTRDGPLDKVNGNLVRGEEINMWQTKPQRTSAGRLVRTTCQGKWRIKYGGRSLFLQFSWSFYLEMSTLICYDFAMGGRTEILKVWLYLRVWYAVSCTIQLCRFLTDFLYI